MSSLRGADSCLHRILEMTAMPRVGSDGHVTAVVKSHYLKKLISISRQDCVAGARTCTPSASNSSTDHGERDAVWSPFRSLFSPCVTRQDR